MAQTKPTLEDEAEFDLFLDKIKNEYKDTWTEENWEEVLENYIGFKIIHKFTLMA
jgi:hypothetical protein